MRSELSFNFSSNYGVKVFSVSEFLDYVNEILNRGNVSIQGEISGWKIHPSGIYFSLKDKKISDSSGQDSILDCYMSPYVYKGLGLNLEEGMEIKVGGIPSIYKPKGRFSFRVEMAEVVGEGSLKKAYEILKKKLESEGLFARKRALPEFIHRIGVITSRTGAVIDDFRKNLEQRGHRVYLYDVRVEGAKAVGNILSAVKWFNRNMPDLDVLIIIRGGGSLEDLQAFNNELVVREVFASKIPTICGIGHDRDVPIVCLVGDATTSTPTAAAMLINATWERLKNNVPNYQRDLFDNFESVVDEMKRCMDVGMIAHAYERLLSEQFQRIESHQMYLESVSPERNLKLGYSILTDTAGKVIKRTKSMKVGGRVRAKLSDGAFTATVDNIE
ncbi:MAG: exodeoxyribonuclease VII large subunit [Patescibacteria group bacterium]